jgi:hypothetical protein
LPALRPLEGPQMSKVASATTVWGDDLPYDDNPVIAAELTGAGWRGLTQRGELLDVRAQLTELPVDVLIIRNGTAVARRKIERGEPRINEYATHHERALQLARDNRPIEALAEIETTLALAPTLFARFNRSMILLQLGRWQEGFAEYRACEDLPPFMRPPVKDALAAGLKPWNGEDLVGKRILLVHAHGFGDSIMALRYVPVLQKRGAEVVLQLPHELLGLGAQLAPVVSDLRDAHWADYFCPLLHLVGLLELKVEAGPYLKIEREAVQDWRELLGPGPHIGIAWTPGVQSTDDFPRAIELGQLVNTLRGAQLHSMQMQGAEEAFAHGVNSYQFGDFSDCAAAMLAMDQIISIDTAALHLAGAIGHPNVVGLLSYWRSWRWLASWYSNIRIITQASAGHWASALRQI